MERLYTSTYTGVTNFEKTVRLLAHPVYVLSVYVHSLLALAIWSVMQ